MSKPNAAKIVHLLVSVGSDDTRSMADFEEALKAIIKNGSRYGSPPLTTVVGAEYLLHGKTYRRPDYEAWDGSEDTKPRSLFDHNGGPAVVERAAPDHVQKSPAEALAGVKRTPKRARKLSRNDRINNAIDDLEVTTIEGQEFVAAPQPGGESLGGWGGWDE